MRKQATEIERASAPQGTHKGNNGRDNVNKRKIIPRVYTWAHDGGACWMGHTHSIGWGCESELGTSSGGELDGYDNGWEDWMVNAGTDGNCSMDGADDGGVSRALAGGLSIEMVTSLLAHHVVNVAVADTAGENEKEQTAKRAAPTKMATSQQIMLGNTHGLGVAATRMPAERADGEGPSRKCHRRVRADTTPTSTKDVDPVWRVDTESTTRMHEERADGEGPSGKRRRNVQADIAPPTSAKGGRGR